MSETIRILNYLILLNYEILLLEAIDKLKIYFEKDDINYQIELEKIDFKLFHSEFEKVQKQRIRSNINLDRNIN